MRNTVSGANRISKIYSGARRIVVRIANEMVSKAYDYANASLLKPGHSRQKNGMNRSNLDKKWTMTAAIVVHTYRSVGFARTVCAANDMVCGANDMLRNPVSEANGPHRRVLTLRSVRGWGEPQYGV
jgi:hypothetical protein